MLEAYSKHDTISTDVSMILQKSCRHEKEIYRGTEVCLHTLKRKPGDTYHFTPPLYLHLLASISSSFIANSHAGTLGVPQDTLFRNLGFQFVVS